MRYFDYGKEETRVRSLQKMLRHVGIEDGITEYILPINGIFDQQTEDAVKAFQKEYGLNQSGIYDYETYSKLSGRYKELSSSDNMSINPYPSQKDYVLSAGDESDLVTILQMMLGALSIYYDLPYVPLSGHYDLSTENAVREFQRTSDLGVNGRVDRLTWNRLAQEYNRSVNESQ